MPVNSIANNYYPGYYNVKPKSVTELPDRYVCTYEKEASTGKKIGVGIASCFVPGLGQAINGDWGKSVGFFLGDMGLSALCGFILARAAKSSLDIAEKIDNNKLTEIFKKSLKNHIGGTIASIAAIVGLNIWGIVDAVKSAKSTVDVDIMKNQINQTYS